MKKQLTDKERIHREEQSIKIEEKDFELIPVSVNIYFILYNLYNDYLFIKLSFLLYFIIKFNYRGYRWLNMAIAHYR